MENFFRSLRVFIIIYLWLVWRAGWLAPPTWQSHGIKIKHTHCCYQQNMKVKSQRSFYPEPKTKEQKIKNKTKNTMDQENKRTISHTCRQTFSRNHTLLKYWSHIYCSKAEQFPSRFYTFTLHKIQFALKLLQLHILNFNIIFLQLQIPNIPLAPPLSPPQAAERAK